MAFKGVKNEASRDIANDYFIFIDDYRFSPIGILLSVTYCWRPKNGCHAFIHCINLFWWGTNSGNKTEMG